MSKFMHYIAFPVMGTERKHIEVTLKKKRFCRGLKTGSTLSQDLTYQKVTFSHGRKIKNRFMTHLKLYH